MYGIGVVDAVARTQERGAVPSEGQVRVLVVDDHDLFRVGLAQALSAYADMNVVAQASTGKLAVRLAAEIRPDVILLDLRLPDLDGPAAARQIVENNPAARIVIFSAMGSEPDIVDAVAAGACGYLLKDAPLEDVAAAIRAAAAGTAWLTPRAAEALMARVRDEPARGSDPEPRVDLLSPREVEVLGLVALGLDNNEIAAELSVSPRTAKNHVSSILSKLGLSNRVQAAIYAVRSGIV